MLIGSDIRGRDLNPAAFWHACPNVAGATDTFIPPLFEQCPPRSRHGTTAGRHL